MVTSEIVYRIFATANLDAAIDSTQLSVQDYVTSKLQQAFLPWPFSLIYLLPNWLVITGLSLLILTLVKVFINSCLAIFHLVRDSSMSLIYKVAAACLPAIAITKKRQSPSILKAEEEYPLNNTSRALEERISELEKNVTKMLLIKTKSKVGN